MNVFFNFMASAIATLTSVTNRLNELMSKLMRWAKKDFINNGICLKKVTYVDTSHDNSFVRAQFATANLKQMVS